MQDKLNSIAPGGTTSVHGSFKGKNKDKLWIERRGAGAGAGAADHDLDHALPLTLPSSLLPAMPGGQGTTEGGGASTTSPTTSPKSKADSFPAKLPRIPHLEEVIDDFYKERGGKQAPK